jgi:4-hydroxy-tetrahydrodipicolinate synthase
MMADLMEAALAGDIKRANELHYLLYPLMKTMFAAPNPVPAKKGVELLGRIRDGRPRLPLTAIDEASLAKLKAAMGEAGLL